MTSLASRALGGAIAAAALSAGVGQAAAEGVFNPQMFTLGNGMRIVLIENQAMPAVGHIMYMGVGSADEAIGESGIAHLFEHLQFKGTPSHPDGEFSDTISLVGGQENAFTTWDYTGYYQIVAPEHLATMMELEADRMTNTVLTPDVIDTERQVVYEEFATRIGNQPSSWLGIEARRALYSHHPYGTPIIGYMDELAAVSHEDIIAFYRKWYAPGNAVAVIAGPVTLDELRPLAERTYGQVPAAPTPERVRVTEPEHYAPRRVTMQHPQIGQASWARYYLAPSYTAGDSEHAYALQVLAEIMGYGTDSRFYQSIVLDQGLAIGAGASYGADAMDLSAFVLWGTPPVTGDDQAAVAAIETAIDAEVARILDEGVTQAEVDSAARQLQADAIFARDSLMAGAQTVGEALVTGRSIEDVESWPDRIAAVTADQVNAAARAVFVLNNSVTSIMLPEPAM
ncbi:MAG: pitrilysin family protein [Alphaproteobacteria bacterium]